MFHVGFTSYHDIFLISVSLHEMLCKDKKLKAKLKVLKGDKQGGVLKVLLSFQESSGKLHKPG